jgi:hypothetical protein
MYMPATYCRYVVVSYKLLVHACYIVHVCSSQSYILHAHGYVSSSNVCAGGIQVGHIGDTGGTQGGHNMWGTEVGYRWDIAEGTYLDCSKPDLLMSRWAECFAVVLHFCSL